MAKFQKSALDEAVEIQQRHCMQNVAPAGRMRQRCSSLTDTELSITQNQQVEDTGKLEDYYHS